MEGGGVKGWKPLNGEKTHPLSRHALAAIERLRRGPVACRVFNPGVVNRLLREPNIELVWRPFGRKNIQCLRLVKPANAEPLKSSELTPEAKE